MKLHIVCLLVLSAMHIEALPKHNNGRVVGGLLAEKNQFPWQAALTCCQDGFLLQSCSGCGGSLISKNFILTAGHCTEKQTHFDIELGSIHRFQAEEYLKSIEKIEHPEYDSVKLENDVALIKLPRDVKLSEAIQIVPLVSANIGDLVKKNVLASGFGLKTFRARTPSLKLNFIGLNIIDNASSSKAFVTTISKMQMCAVAQSSYQTLCSGDSGGPLVMHDGNSYVQVGVISFTYENCVPGEPTGYARVSSYKNWILENMSK